jgi:quercetin dioxygenase-like cupin family protein
MIIVKSSEVKAVESTEEIVAKGHGMVHRQLLIDEKMAGGVQAAIVSFNPGARLNFHTHANEQVLYVLDGTGIVATEKEEREVTVGAVIVFPPGERHWHGATKNNWFTHLAVFRGDAKK